MNTHEVDVLVLGLGTAAYSFANNFSKVNKTKKVMLIGRDGGNSAVSHWNFNVEPTEVLYPQMVKNLGTPDNSLEGTREYEYRLQLVNYFLENRDKAIGAFYHELALEYERGGVDNCELHPRGHLPAKKVLSAYKVIAKEAGFDVRNASIESIDPSGQKVSVVCKNGEGYFTVFASIVVVGTGGGQHIMADTTGVPNRKHANVSMMLTEAGLKSEGLDRIFYHPILIDDIIAGKVKRGLVSPEFTATCDFYFRKPDGELVDFLLPHLKQALAERAYLANLGEISKAFNEVSQSGNEVVMCTKMTEEDLFTYKMCDPYGHMFWCNKSVEEIRQIRIKPGAHYTLGGLVTNTNCQSVSDERFFVLGEAASLYGNGRSRGFGHIDSITLSPLAAKTALGML
jgi:hypothetical protein